MLDINHFRIFIKQTRGIKDRTIDHYVSGLCALNLLLWKENCTIYDVWSIQTIDDLEKVKTFLFSNETFLQKNTTGHQMYSAAFKHFYRYAYKTISSQIVG